jgi:hypothetical protein
MYLPISINSSVVLGTDKALTTISSNPLQILQKKIEFLDHSKCNIWALLTEYPTDFHL